MKHAVITGTNRGLGLEFVKQYLELGWRVSVMNRSTSPALDALTGNPQLKVLNGDLAQPAELERLAGELAGSTIDLLINNAGIMGTDTFRLENMQRQGLADFSRDEWRAVFEINVMTPAQLIALLKERFVAGSKVITISSSMGSISGNSFGGWYAYRASKAAVNSLMKSASLELADAGVLTAALHPGWVRTDMGGPDADIDARQSISGMMRVIEDLGAETSGQFIGFDGEQLAY